MNKLDELLLIPDKRTRHQEMVNYANALGIDTAEAKDSTGEYIEERLAILIFDAQQNENRNRRSNYQLLLIGGVVFLTVILLFMIMPKLIMKFRQNEKEDLEKKKSYVTGLDSEGQSVKYELLHGTYRRYDENANLKFEYYYENGELVRQKEFDKEGEVVE